MRGNSGAFLERKGEMVVKTCSDAIQQVKWFKLASNLPIVNGLKIPFTKSISNSVYEIEFIEGKVGTHCHSSLIIETLVDQIIHWRDCKSNNDLLTWADYLKRINEQHIQTQDCGDVIKMAFDFVSKMDKLCIPSSFCHGDLTLENVIINHNGEIVLIDPNFKENLFQSYILDFGKLLQSTHSNYHLKFNSSPGVDLTSHHYEVLMRRLDCLDIVRESLVVEITHILRLRRYQPPHMRKVVDELIEWLVSSIRYGKTSLQI